MYLSSWRLGRAADELLLLSGGAGSVAVVANALDSQPEPARRNGVLFELASMRELGFHAVEVDLRVPGAARELPGHDTIWVRGGNVFALRAAMARSGADVVISDLVRSDAIVYAGYSAGCCVLAPSLRGLELVDDPTVVDEPCWEGLGLLEYAILPHYRSDHPESEAIELAVESYRERGVPHRTLRDGEVIVLGL
jgi:dipeptidase E